MSWYNEALAGWYRSKIESANAMEQGIASFGNAIGKAIEETRQNSMANQIGSQEANSGAYAPRAGLVGLGNNPATGDENSPDSMAPGTPTQGTAPAQFTGGYKGLQLQTAIDSLRRQQANTQSEIGLRQAQAGYYGAHTDYLNKQSDINQQRANTYQDRVNQKGADTIQKLNTELADTYGKNAPPHILGALQQDPTGAQHRGDVQTIDGKQVWVPNPNGKTFIPDAPQPTPEDKGGMFGWGAHPAQPQPLSGTEIQIPWEQAQKYRDRYTSISNGGSGGGGGNPPQVTNAQDYAKIPSGQQYVDPNGITRTKP